jgi:hypothetical protein
MDPYKCAKTKHRIEYRIHRIEDSLQKDEYMYSRDIWDALRQLEADVHHSDWGGYHHNVDHYRSRIHKLRAKMISPSSWWMCC